MGLSNMTAPNDSLFVFLLYNTAVSITILTNLVRAVLAFVGLPVPAAADDDGEIRPASHAPTLAERFRGSFKPARFGQRRRAGGGGAQPQDCRVCLARFQPRSVVYRLPCGHLFHGACLETWLDYNRATCPLCRLRLLPAADEPPSLPAPHFAPVY